MMLCYAVFAASYSLAFLSFPYRAVRNLSQGAIFLIPSLLRPLTRWHNTLHFYTQIYMLKYSLQFMKDLFVSGLSITTRKAQKTALPAVTVYRVLLWERPKVQAMANTGKCLCLREAKWVGLSIPTQNTDILLTTDAWIWPRQQTQSLIT